MVRFILNTGSINRTLISLQTSHSWYIWRVHCDLDIERSLNYTENEISQFASIQEVSNFQSARVTIKGKQCLSQLSPVLLVNS